MTGAPMGSPVGRVRGRSRRHSPVLPALTLNMTAMIDCVFMLLMFFILTVDFRPREDALAIDPAAPASASDNPDPGAGDAFALPDRPVMIGVDSTGDGADDYVLRGDEPALGSFTTFAQLEARATSARGTTLPAGQTFAVRPSADARWEHALGAMNALQRAGFVKVRMTEPEAAK